MRAMSCALTAVLLSSVGVWAKGGGFEIAFSPDGTLLAVNHQKEIRLYEARVR